MSSYDYTGKKVFIGIDVHKDQYTCVCLGDGRVLRKEVIRAHPATLIEHLKKYFLVEHLETAYEAGFSGLHLHRALVEAGICNRIIHPASREHPAGGRLKTDKRDAYKIAHQLALGYLKGIHVPSLEQESQCTVSRFLSSMPKGGVR